MLNSDALTAQLDERLSRIPRHRLIFGETPLHELSGVSRTIGRRVFVKRDDLTGLAFGGNKVRQAEFFIGQAIAEGADTIVAGGSFAQSNHARVMAAAANAAGLESVILIRPGGGPTGESASGNALTTRLLASEVRVVDALADAPAGDRRAEVEFRRAVFAEEADRLRAAGRRPYVVLGSSTALGVLGYVSGALELQRQAKRLDLRFSTVFLTSLGATHAGLELGARILGAAHDVVGVAYQPTTAEEAESTVTGLAEAAARLLGTRAPALSVQTDVAEAGDGYGLTTAASRRALVLAAAQDALLLDPSYTAKGFAAMLRQLEAGDVPGDDPVLFVHTGGLPALFGRTFEDLVG
jgi:1-aminocyclopropane-1-carboxylate deaminase/D-cysteine desulfhydrase-like pyridoxal-dependent ACC family enzyme